MKSYTMYVIDIILTLPLFLGFVVPFKAHFNEDSPIWLLGRCYHARNHGKYCSSLHLPFSLTLGKYILFGFSWVSVSWKKL